MNRASKKHGTLYQTYLIERVPEARKQRRWKGYFSI
jgi:hypothetical protein